MRLGRTSKIAAVLVAVALGVVVAVPSAWANVISYVRRTGDTMSGKLTIGVSGNATALGIQTDDYIQWGTAGTQIRNGLVNGSLSLESTSWANFLGFRTQGVATGSLPGFSASNAGIFIRDTTTGRPIWITPTAVEPLAYSSDFGSYVSTSSLLTTLGALFGSESLSGFCNNCPDNNYFACMKTTSEDFSLSGNSLAAMVTTAGTGSTTLSLYNQTSATQLCSISVALSPVNTLSSGTCTFSGNPWGAGDVICLHRNGGTGSPQFNATASFKISLQ